MTEITFMNKGSNLEIDNILSPICMKRNAHLCDNAFQSGFCNVWSIDREANYVLHQSPGSELLVDD